MAGIPERREVPAALAHQLAAALHTKDALWISELTAAQPQVAVGLLPEASVVLWVTVWSLIFLVVLSRGGAMACSAVVWGSASFLARHILPA